MKKAIFFIGFQICLFTLHAQSTEDSVKAVIDRLFHAMKSSDGKTLQDCFADSAILQTIARNGMIRNESAKGFAQQISTLPKDSADERITYEILKVDDGLATVWTPYQFYYAGKFSHCGVNSFQLIRQRGLWKIQYLIDTRRKEPCR